jgi:LIM and senescent cell antigen-like-containing domain protein 1/2
MSSFESIICVHCKIGFSSNEEIINASGDTYHSTCFVCAQCFCPFENETYYEFEKRKYCESDFKLLFAPYCKLCQEFINGRVIKALNSSWHPNCFKCVSCGVNLAESGFSKSGTKILCRRCHNEEKIENGGKATCNKCL